MSAAVCAPALRECPPDAVEAESEPNAVVSGITPEAIAGERQKLERLCRYISRGLR